MADQENIQGGTETAASQASTEAQQEPKAKFDMSRFIRGAFGGRTAPVSDEAQGESAGAEGAGSEAGSATSSGSAAGTSEHETDSQKPATLTLTEEELARRIQGEVDRREQRRAASERQKQLKDLRDENPIEYARQTERVEQEQEAIARKAAEVHGLTQQFDASMLGPVMTKLDEKERAEAYKDLPDDPYKARTHLIDKGIALLVKKAEATAEKRLRESPAFRKQLLAELRTNMNEPDAIEGQPSPNGGKVDMNFIMRRQAGII